MDDISYRMFAQVRACLTVAVGKLFSDCMGEVTVVLTETEKLQTALMSGHTVCAKGKDGIHMRIEGNGGMSAVSQGQVQPGIGSGQDNQLKALQKQIVEVQEQLRQVNADKEMEPETKAEKTKALQQELQSLRQQMTQRKQEIRQEAQEKQAARQEESMKKDTRAQKGMVDNETIQGIVTADHSLKESKAMRDTQKSLEGKARTLASEISLDSARNGDTSAKQEQLSGLEEKISNINEKVADKLSDVNQKVSDNKGDAAKTAGADEEDIKTVKEEETTNTEEAVKKETENAAGDGNLNSSGFRRYTPVDVRI